MHSSERCSRALRGRSHGAAVPSRPGRARTVLWGLEGGIHPDPEDVLEQAAVWQDAGHGVALATVVKTWGASPRPAGSQLAVDDRGRFVGSVSGGCVEGAVVGAAGEVIASKEPRMLEFGVTDEKAWEVGLACGGRIRIHVAMAIRPLLDALLADRKAKRPAVLVSWLERGAARVVHPQDPDAEVAPGFTEVAPELLEAARAAARRDQSRLWEEDGEPVFLQVFNPPLRMIVVGAVHIAQHLWKMAELAGFEVIVVDPRRGFATEERFPAVSLRVEWPAQAFAALVLDRRTAVVVLTHDPKVDDPALAAALRSPAFYIGALGSTRNQAKRLQRLRERGFDDADLARIKGPVGLDIGARTAAEVAVAIVAEAVQALRKASG
ncbi:MAG: XdhC family protein [Deltaproteobacteria bacterium]|nr:XdhC family protein [Deltaproteobacteria bacterium]